MKLSFKENAKNYRGNTGQMLVGGVPGASQDCRMSLGTSSTVKRFIRRHVQTGRPKDPASSQELLIEGTEWELTGGEQPEQFLIYDSGPEDVNRIIIFGTELCLRKLADARTWYMDGTFKVAPAIFTQLYVIRVPLADSAISCIYAFTQRKE